MNGFHPDEVQYGVVAKHFDVAVFDDHGMTLLSDIGDGEKHGRINIDRLFLEFNEQRLKKTQILRESRSSDC